MKLELCVTDLEGMRLAKKYKFNRIELCVNLEQGGTTPSNGLVKLALRQKLETHVLIRPRIGGFCYEDSEKETLLSEIHSLLNLPVSGFVVGALKHNKEIDSTLLGEIIKLTKQKELTFHRAFDEMANWEDGSEVLKCLHFKRVLTSGLATNVDAGIPNYAKIKEVFRDKIELMTGGGVNPKNIFSIIQNIQPDAIHFSATSYIDLENSKFATTRMKIDEKKLVSMLQAINYI
jgi:copper homeostasis protein